MEISSNPSKSNYTITHYDEKSITINGRNYCDSLVIFPETIHAPWNVTNIADLTHDDIEWVIKKPCDFILFGTGKTTIIPNDDLIKPIYEKNIGFEFMSSQAAIRLLIILLSEQRPVTACLIL